MIRLIAGKRPFGLGCVVGLMLLIGASAASAETLLMPKRDFLMSTSEVVWGVSTLPSVVGSTYDLDFGDGSAHATGNLSTTDRSYIAFNHTYALSGAFTVTLSVTNGSTETATVPVNVYNAALLSAADLRGLNINRAIQDGLRYFWQDQLSRSANFPTAVTTTWNGLSYPSVENSLIVLAFENHGYLLPNDDSTPTGIYEKYIVRRGLNFVINKLYQLSLTITPNGGDPCVGGVGPAPCVGLYSAATGYPGYEAAITILPLAGSTALNRHVAEITGSNNAGFVVGKTYGEVLQRMMDAMAWGQIDGNGTSTGGWGYTFNSGTADGSTMGWNILALLDGAAAGTAIPAFVKTEFTAAGHAGPTMENADGTFDYNPAVNGDFYPNMARVGVGLQALFYQGNTGAADPAVAAGINAASGRWVTSAGFPSDYLSTCGSATTNNKGCAYAMFNVFKGLKLQNINSLPAAADWYGEYQDYLVSTQTNHTTLTGGQWGSLIWSCCASIVHGSSALAELILAPVALVQPDPTLFSTVGLTPFTDTNPVGTDHTVTAFVQSNTNTPIAGATVGFAVLTGPNAGASGTCAPIGCVSGADGKVAFTYHDNNGAGTDTIQANIGSLKSNIVNKIWVVPTIKCDADGDGKVTQADLAIIRAANGQAASGPTDPRDGNSDGAINVADWRYCQLRLTPPSGH
jgi:hypothetical protein